MWKWAQVSLINTSFICPVSYPHVDQQLFDWTKLESSLNTDMSYSRQLLMNANGLISFEIGFGTYLPGTEYIQVALQGLIFHHFPHQYVNLCRKVLQQAMR